MTTAANAGTARTQSNTAGTRRTAPVQPNRRAEDPFSAAKGSLHFSSERKAAPARSAAAASKSGTSAVPKRTAGSAQKRSTSGSSSQPPKKRKRRRKKNTRLLIAAIGFLVFAVVLLVAAIVFAGNCHSCKTNNPDLPLSADPNASATPGAIETPIPMTDDTVISRNVTVEGVNVRNLSVRDARERVKTALDEKLDLFDITVAYESYEPLSLDAQKIDLRYTDDDLNEALRAAASGTEAEISVALTYDHDLLKAALQELNDKIPNHAVNAKAEVKYKSREIDGTTYYQPYWEFTGGVNGAKIDFDTLEQQIVDAIRTGDFTASLTPQVAVSEPETTLESLQSKITLLSSYQTNYATKAGSNEPDLDANNRARDWNISKAVGLMQVTVLEPGQTFDFNKKTGERSEKKGWAPANAVYHGTGYRPEPGGGVCQVSTTIFNAVLRAGITNITRRGHSIPSNYVTKKFEEGLGLDATVDYGNIEFKFKNDTGHTIYVFIYITKNNSRRKNINVEIYGQKEEGVEYRVRNEILEQTPSNDESKIEYEYDKTMLATAKRVLIRAPHDGYRVKTYVDKYKDGKFVKTVRTEETVYKVIYPKYRVGTATITPAPTKTPKPADTPKPEDTPVGGEEP